MPVRYTTLLPDAQPPSLGNGVEDEIAVSIPDVTNNGSYRLQIRETNESSWDDTAVGFAEQTVSSGGAASGTVETLVTGREDGEAYEVRVRSETEHRTGAWTQPVRIVTAFPGAANPSAASVSATSITITAQDNADNEDGFTLQREEQIAGSWTDRRTITAQDAHSGTGSLSFVDDTATPGRSYRYRITAHTEHTSAASSWTSSVSTPDLDDNDPHPAAAHPVPPQGWHIELDHPDTGHTRRLRLADATPKPRLNARPELDIPIPADNHWVESAAWEDATVRAYHNGTRLPIDTIATITPEPDRVTLTARGGSHLLARANDEFTDVRVETAIEEILTTNTDYAVEVDAPPATTNQEWRTLDTAGDFDLRPGSGGPHKLTGDGGVQPQQTAWILPPQAFSAAKTVGDVSANWTSSEAIELPLNTSTGASVEIPYRIPDGALGLAGRVAIDGGGFLYARVDGQPSSRYASQLTSASSDPPRMVDWQTINNHDLPRGLDAGTQSVSVEFSDGGDLNSNGSAFVDCLVVYDRRYWSADDFSNTLTADNKLDGPPGLYAPVDVEWEVSPLRRATGGQLTASVSSTANGQALGLSMTGEDWTTRSGTTALDVDFDSSTASFTARVTLSGVDAQSPASSVESSVTRYQTRPQVLDSLTMAFDAVDSPGVIKTVDATVADAITSLCDRGNLIWEVQYDKAAGMTVVVTRPGQRPTQSVREELVDWTVTKDVEASPTAAIVHGRNATVREEEFTAEINNVELLHAPIVVGSTTVTDGDGREFERGADADYVVDHVLGEIRMPNLGSELTRGESYTISYERQTVGEYYSVEGSGQPVITDLPGVTTETEAEQAALYIVDESEGPVVSASCTLAGSEIGYRLTRALDLDGLPDVGGLRVESVTGQGGEVQVELGLGRSVGDVVGELQGTLTDTARQT